MKEFTKAIQSIAYRHSIMQVFDDFLELAVCAFAMGRLEERYHEIMNRYDERERNAFPEALAALVKAYEDVSTPDGKWGDPLGHFFEEHSSQFGRSAMGQFFTPVTVCEFMAQIVTIDADADGDRTETVNDCACGSGRNLIAHARVNPQNRLNHIYVGQDLDRRCVLMATINMVMYGLRGYVIHMDTLRMEIYGGYRVYLPETGLGVAPMSKEACMALLFAPKPDEPEQELPPPPIPPPEITQLTLF